uniref:Uncharacterized protein n=1 Tax=Palpitomonas bilix TaxID=652834 RepID=A0A7S3GHF9_9EUKA
MGERQAGKRDVEMRVGGWIGGYLRISMAFQFTCASVQTCTPAHFLSPTQHSFSLPVSFFFIFTLIFENLHCAESCIELSVSVASILKTLQLKVRTHAHMLPCTYTHR